MAKKFWNADKVVSTAAILISLMTLIVFIWQTNLLRQQQHLSVLPYLSFGNERMGTPNYRYTLTNNGIGPAFVKSVRITGEDEPLALDIPSYLLEYVPAFDSLRNVAYANIYPGRLIPAGEKIEILVVQNSLTDAQKLVQILGKLAEEGKDFEIVYCSIYERCWRMTTNLTEPEAVE